jgi:hypothetical protein
MATKRILNVPIKSFAMDSYFSVAVFTGAGAAAPTVAASTVIKPQFNYGATQSGVATTIVRNGVGDHTFTFPESPTVVLWTKPMLDGTTNLNATQTTVGTTNNRLTVRVLTATPAGVATDLATTDTLRILIFGADSSV